MIIDQPVYRVSAPIQKVKLHFTTKTIIKTSIIII